jgi:hypothetical protein
VPGGKVEGNLNRILSPKYGSSLHGWNGHFWSRLVCGHRGNAFVINAPGPYQEARAAIEAFAGLGDPGETIWIWR